MSELTDNGRFNELRDDAERIQHADLLDLLAEYDRLHDAAIAADEDALAIKAHNAMIEPLPTEYEPTPTVATDQHDSVRAMAQALVENGYGTKGEKDASNVLASYERHLEQEVDK